MRQLTAIAFKPGSLLLPVARHEQAGYGAFPACSMGRKTKGCCNSLLQQPLQCRGDWTPLELFLVSVRDWEAGLRRIFECETSGERH
jgi:hypothetical protein